MIEKPFDTIHRSLGEPVMITLKNGRVFKGTLTGYDTHMNLVLTKVEEVEHGEVVREVSYLVIRGGWVLFLSPSIT